MNRKVAAIAAGLVMMTAGISPLFGAEVKKETIGLWHFDKGEGEIAKDSSGNGNDLSLSGTMWAEGKKGKCLSFDGEKSYAFASKISDSLVFLADEFTISAWIKPDYVYPKDYEIVNCGCGNRGPGYRLLIAYGDIMFRSGDGFDEGKEYWGVRTPRFKKGKIPEKVLKKGWYAGELDNRWYHVAVTYKDGTYRIYVDGSLAVEKKERPIKPNPNDKSLTIGSYRGKHCYFKGLIDELEILSRAKTGEEIIEDALMGLI